MSHDSQSCYIEKTQFAIELLFSLRIYVKTQYITVRVISLHNLKYIISFLVFISNINSGPVERGTKIRRQIPKVGKYL